MRPIRHVQYCPIVNIKLSAAITIVNHFSTFACALENSENPLWHISVRCLSRCLTGNPLGNGHPDHIRLAPYGFSILSQRHPDLLNLTISDGMGVKNVCQVIVAFVAFVAFVTKHLRHVRKIPQGSCNRLVCFVHQSVLQNLVHLTSKFKVAFSLKNINLVHFHTRNHQLNPESVACH